MNGIQQHVYALLDSVSCWNDVTCLAKSRYQAELAPDFSLVDWLKNDELALSRYLRFLLSPVETHGQSALFLERFLSLVGKSGHDSPILVSGGHHHKVRVDYEVTIENGRKIDLLLTSSDGVIAIENKPWAADQENQLRDYAEWLNKRERPWKLVYLCNNEPGSRTLPENTPDALKKNIITISWFQIVGWLTECALHVRAGSIRIFVESLIKYINQSINSEFVMDNNSELLKIILKDIRSIESAFLIHNEINDIRRCLLNELISDLNKGLTGYPFVVECDNEASVRYGTNFYIRFHPKSHFSLCWAFDRSNYNDLYFGISDESHGVDKGTTEKINKFMSECFPTLQGKPNKHWSWWSWDLDPQGRNRIPKNWSNDGTVWATLRERDENSIFAAIREVIQTVYEKMDLDLLR
ncbi:Uncharacterised protein [Yersinia intermedia]|uniref:PD-(D/E)XK nuclease superfamily n=1 Tax=Yersinia intermedia TaxID=631 RepID=A0A0T9N5R9_YERIN|nr:PD-(D/E)XK nuclease family protein [Yersinia intermedia]EKN3392567.1 PD-(D/E)XK nuclease family protein [Yersinia enterocolitica]OVZ84356.1 hypothetical protein CBW57_17570 [Yersinia intermedia]CNG79168.1 Uncharacterised protein [Yersinia intermedia]CNK47326.1 Uncharacterised protein [Yersinia intermedia]